MIKLKKTRERINKIIKKFGSEDTPSYTIASKIGKNWINFYILGDEIYCLVEDKNIPFIDLSEIEQKEALENLLSDNCKINNLY